MVLLLVVGCGSHLCVKKDGCRFALNEAGVRLISKLVALPILLPRSRKRGEWQILDGEDELDAVLTFAMMVS
ncbi:hypothetical protein Nepgr_018717 [Nepenthes gracilis]|uniref:Uncharacterized protein n=1 Tax=Nepenthes gracilis TaxID=150966 RepID=A0AAD3XUL2_NEPGR|nr:hypothetical protein Nepgr_018717 [Nepenthes gracilis]